MAETLDRVEREHDAAPAAPGAYGGNVVTVAVVECNVGHGYQPRPRGDHAFQRGDVQPFSWSTQEDRTDADAAEVEPRICVRAELVVGQDDLIALPPVQPVGDEQRAVGRGTHERDLIDLRVQRTRDLAAHGLEARFDVEDA